MAKPVIYTHQSAIATCRTIGAAGLVEVKHLGLLNEPAFEVLRREVMHSAMVCQAAAVVLRFDTALVTLNRMQPVQAHHHGRSKAQLFYVVPWRDLDLARSYAMRLADLGINAQVLRDSPVQVDLAYRLAAQAVDLAQAQRRADLGPPLARLAHAAPARGRGVNRAGSARPLSVA